MKYKILTIVTVIAIVLIFRLSVSKDQIEDYELVYEQVEQYTHNVYYYDDNKLVYINITFDNEIEINFLFDLLTNRSNTFSHDYDTKLITSTQLISFEINNENIILNLSSDFLRYNDDDCYEILTQLRSTFSNLGYTKLFLKVEDNFLESLGYININDGITLTNF